jgi:putative cell wall-binding protein
VPTVVLATGEGFADALAGGPVAAELGGPVLLTGSDHMPSSVLDELVRLAPQRILLLGGTAAITDDVLDTVERATGLAVERIAGSSRYDTAAAAAMAAFGNPVDRVYVATGTGFADALAGGAAAAAHGSPVLLVQPDRVPAATAEALAALSPDEVVVLGGTDAIGDAVADQLGDLTGASVTRLAGDDRYATAAAVALATITDDAPIVFIAAGGDYPDALTGVPPAGESSAPLLLVAHDRVPDTTAAALAQLGPRRFVVLGGEAAVGDAVIDHLRTLLR